MTHVTSRPLRRFRRRLLLPPGWLVLSFLLLLGCLLLRAQEQRLRPANVLQLTMPQRPRRQRADEQAQAAFSIYAVRQQVGSIRHWSRLHFTGHRFSDSLTAQQLGPVLGSLQASLDRRRGLLIYLAPATPYKYLVRVLDALNQHDVKRYALDNYRSPTVLYVPGPRFVPRPTYSPGDDLLPRIQPLAL